MRTPTDSQPLISVVIPTFKRPDYLARAIESVLKQTYANWELVVVDDNGEASEFRKSTESLMYRYASDPRIEYLKHSENRGGSAARNTGIQRTSGEYVAFLDDDDEWLPTKLEAQKRCFERASQNTALIYTGLTIVGTESGVRRVSRPTLRGKILEPLLRKNHVRTTSTILCKRAALLSIGMFDESLAARQDIDLYIRLAEKYEFDFVSEPLVNVYRHSQDSIGKNSRGAAEAHTLFLQKHETLLSRYPKTYGHRLKIEGIKLLRAGQKAEAGLRFSRARNHVPTDLSLLILLLASRIGGYNLFRQARVRAGRLKVRVWPC